MTIVKERSVTKLPPPPSMHRTFEVASQGPPPIYPLRRRHHNRWPPWRFGLTLLVAFAAFAAIPPPDQEGDDVVRNALSVTETATSTPVTDPTPAPSSPDPGIKVEPATPATAEQAVMIADALTQFDNAGLELPDVQIEFYDGYDGCRGHAGLFVAASGNPDSFVDRVTICHQHELILLHELAHVWIHHNVDAGTKAAFVEHWGLNSWSNPSDPYVDQGVERAAQTIAFTLNQTEATENQAILRYICGYELLTGTTIEIHTEVGCSA